MAEYSIFMQYDPQDKIYIASIPALQGCMVHGETKEEALKEIEIAKELWIETAIEDGEEIPKPLAWDSDYTKVTSAERKALEDAEKDIAENGTISHDAINWD